MFAVQLVLAGLLVVAGWSLAYPSPAIAVVLAALSAAWLPTNNGHLEGPILYTVADHHGLTAADLAAYAGFAFAALAGWRWRQAQLRQTGPDGRGMGRPAALAFIAVLVFLLGCGLTASWLHREKHVHSAGTQEVPAATRAVTSTPAARIADQT
jgi:hypothetical protein